MSLDEKAVELIEERWRVLTKLREVRGRMSSYGRDVEAFEDFSDTAKRLLTDPRWPVTFKVTDQDKTRYGNTGVGIASVLARNVLAQDGGTRYVHICVLHAAAMAQVNTKLEHDKTILHYFFPEVVWRFTEEAISTIINKAIVLRNRRGPPLG